MATTPAWDLASGGLKATATDLLEVGYTTNIETLSSDTITPSFATPSLKERTVAGNVTINAPSANGVCAIRLYNSSTTETRTITLGSGVEAIGTLPDLLPETAYIVSVMRFGSGNSYVQAVKVG